MKPATDTSAEAHSSVIERLRAMSPAARLGAAMDATEVVRRLAEAGIRSRHPDDSPEAVASELTRIMIRGTNIGPASVGAKPSGQ